MSQGELHRWPKSRTEIYNEASYDPKGRKLDNYEAYELARENRTIANAFRCEFRVTGSADLLYRALIHYQWSLDASRRHLDNDYLTALVHFDRALLRSLSLNDNEDTLPQVVADLKLALAHLNRKRVWLPSEVKWKKGLMKAIADTAAKIGIRDFEESTDNKTVGQFVVEGLAAE